MDWLTVAALIAKYGFPFVERIFSNAQNNTPVTQAEFDALKAKIEIPGEVLVPKRPPVPQ